MTNLHKNPLLLQKIETYLTAIGDPFKIEGSIPYVIAECVCGVIKLYTFRDIKYGHVRSCGCFLKRVAGNQSATHRNSNTPLYNTWTMMKGRCYNKNNKSYFRYGGKGIGVCDEWRHSYETFRDWALSNGWKLRLQIDRRDNSKGYSPENCRIVTCKVNSRNRGSNIHITHNGETKILVEWVEFYGLNYSRTMQRYRRGLRGYELFSQEKIPNAKKGWKHSEEAKRKISIAHKGKKGKSPSLEARAAASRTHKGRKWSDNQRANHKAAVIAYHSRKKASVNTRK